MYLRQRWVKIIPVDSARLQEFFIAAKALNAGALAPDESDAKDLDIAFGDLKENLSSLDLDSFESGGADAVRKAMQDISIVENPKLMHQVFYFIDQLIDTFELCDEAFEKNMSSGRKSNLNEALIKSYRMFDLSLVVLDELYKKINDGQKELLQGFAASLLKIKRPLFDFYVDEQGRPDETREFFAGLEFAKKYFPSS